MLGTSAEMINHLPRSNPTWPDEVIRINSLFATAKLEMFNVMMRPEDYILEVVGLRPILLKGDGDTQPFWLEPTLLAKPHDELYDDLQFLTYIAAAGKIIASTVPLIR